MMRTTVLLIVLCVLSFVVQDRAEAAAKDPPGYAQEVARGLSEFEDKNFAEARAHFVRAHALSPSARTLRALGMVEFELKHYAESARLLSEALATNDKPLDAEKRTQAADLLERANGYLGKLTLDIEAETSVTVDGITTNLAPGNELVLEVGDHTLEFQAPGRIAQKRTLSIRGGERSTQHIRLVPLNTPDTASQTTLAASDSTPPKERRALKNPWLWTAVGVLVAGAAAGAAVALTRGERGTKTGDPDPGTSGAPVLGTPR